MALFKLFNPACPHQRTAADIFNDIERENKNRNLVSHPLFPYLLKQSNQFFKNKSSSSGVLALRWEYTLYHQSFNLVGPALGAGSKDFCFVLFFKP